MGSKILQKQWKAYVKGLETSKIKIPEMEALRPFMGASGGVLKRQTRSKKQKEAFKQAAAGVRGVLGRKSSSSAIKQAQKTAKLQRQTKTAGRNAAIAKARKDHKKKPDFDKPLSKSAQKTVQAAEEKYSRMVEILDMGSRSLLSAKVRYELYKALDEDNVDDEDISEYIDKLLEVLDDIPEEAKALNDQDDFYKVLQQIRDMELEDKDDIKAIFTAMVDYPDAHEELMGSVDYWQEHNQDGMGFSQFMSELEQYNEMWNTDNYAEIMQTEEEED